jgi:hypothetical protein
MPFVKKMGFGELVGERPGSARVVPHPTLRSGRSFFDRRCFTGSAVLV